MTSNCFSQRKNQLHFDQSGTAELYQLSTSMPSKHSSTTIQIRLTKSIEEKNKLSHFNSWNNHNNTEVGTESCLNLTNFFSAETQGPYFTFEIRDSV